MLPVLDAAGGGDSSGFADTEAVCSMIRRDAVRDVADGGGGVMGGVASRGSGGSFDSLACSTGDFARSSSALFGS
jgi:hypothetical protein